MKLLIGTNNQGKIKEMMHFFNAIPIEIVTLNDIGLKIPEPEEVGDTIEQNAFIKAKYYAEHTGIMTLADDTGLFVNALNGWPGVLSNRVAATSEDRIDLLLAKLKDLLPEHRNAEFRAALTCYDPNENTYFTAIGELAGTIMETPVDADDAAITYGYNRVFYVESVGKTYAQMDVKEKNSISHRGQALRKIRYFLEKQYNPRHLLVAVGLIEQKGQMLLALRNDPFRPDFHKKWEFPGGVVEYGESAEQALVREVREETGYTVEIVSQVGHIFSYPREDVRGNYQVNLVPFLCRIVWGEEHVSDQEILLLKWVDIQEVTQHELIGKNSELFEELLPEIRSLLE